MNASNTYLKFWPTQRPEEFVFVSISDVLQSGVPIVQGDDEDREDEGEDMETFGVLYFCRGHDEYEVIA